MNEIILKLRTDGKSSLITTIPRNVVRLLNLKKNDVLVLQLKEIKKL